MLIENFEKIINQKYTMYKPSKITTIKRTRKFPNYLLKKSNNSIVNIRTNYFNDLLKKEKIRLDLISKIENTRKTNNVNWMNLLKNVAQPTQPSKFSGPVVRKNLECNN